MALTDLIITDAERTYLRALRTLRAGGRNVATSDIPGMTYVDGHEMTVEQVIALAAGAAKSTSR